MAKKAPAPISNLAKAPGVGVSGGESNRTSRSRVAGSYKPRPAVEMRTEPAPHGLEQPETIKHSGGKSNKALGRIEGTHGGGLNTAFAPEDREAPKPMGLSQPDAVRHSDAAVRTKKLAHGKDTKRWGSKGYVIPKSSDMATM